MDILTRFELRKIIRRKSFYLGISILVVVSIFLTSVLVMGAWITGKNGEELKGIQAIALQKEYDTQLAGPLTEQKVATAVEQYQKVMRDPKNLNEKGEIKNDAYAKYIVKNEQLNSLVRFSFSPVSGYDHYIIDKLTPSEAKTFYQKRMEKISEYLNFDYSYGNYSDKERAFFMQINETIPVPFTMDYVTGWKQVFQNLQSLFIIIAFVTAVCLAPVFAGEYQCGADSIILSSRYGRNKVISAKLKASCTVSLLLLLVALTIYTLLILGIYGFYGGGASVQMIDLLAPVPYTVFQTYLWVILIGSLGCMFVGMVTLWLSSIMKSSFQVIITIGFFLIGPMFIPASKSSRLFNHIMDLLPANMFDGFKKVTSYEVFSVFGQLIPEYKVMAGFAIIMIVLLLPVSYRAFKNHQVV
ncbi:ABC transporter permease [Paenibacillus sp. ACRRX]|uniref:ABC transporter permease subunit n=1 Tax=Paenibacillus sp. ACRRX TaxID=2918206 RepID=UPI001EF6E98F|nr:ABC transporter permease subunit [Paenibacillus sp. ACRRX]MCG7410158.1 ABC transporter permease [Paenibacillus sp. ACRRX]